MDELLKTLKDLSSDWLSGDDPNTSNRERAAYIRGLADAIVAQAQPGQEDNARAAAAHVTAEMLVYLELQNLKSFIDDFSTSDQGLSDDEKICYARAFSDVIVAQAQPGQEDSAMADANEYMVNMLARLGLFYESERLKYLTTGINARLRKQTDETPGEYKADDQDES